MKKEVGVILSLFLFLPFISAQFLGRLGSVADAFSLIDPQTIFIVVTCGVFFALLKTILDKFQGFQGAPSGIISILLSLAMTYAVNKWFSLNDLLLNVGYSGNIFPYLLIAFLILLIFFTWKYKWKALFAVGLLLVIISFTDFVYEQGAILTMGIIIAVISLFWAWKRRNVSVPSSSGPSRIGALAKRRPMWIISLIGIVLTVIGFWTGQLFLIIPGIVLLLIGLFGKKGWSETLAQGRDMSLRRAREEAYKEDQEREMQIKRARVALSIELQKLYNEQKRRYQNTSSPIPARQEAGEEMKRIIAHARKNGINLSY